MAARVSSGMACKYSAIAISLYDHRYDDALCLNRAIVRERLKMAEKVFEKYKEEASMACKYSAIAISLSVIYSP